MGFEGGRDRKDNDDCHDSRSVADLTRGPCTVPAGPSHDRRRLCTAAKSPPARPPTEAGEPLNLVSEISPCTFALLAPRAPDPRFLTSLPTLRNCCRLCQLSLNDLPISLSLPRLRGSLPSRHADRCVDHQFRFKGSSVARAYCDCASTTRNGYGRDVLASFGARTDLGD